MQTRMQTRTAVGVGLVLLAAGLQAPVLGVTPAAPTGVLDGPERAVIAKRIIGRTVKDRPIRAYRLGDRDNRWTVVAIGAMHGNEQQTPRPLLHLRDHLTIKGVNLWGHPGDEPGRVPSRRSQERPRGRPQPQLPGGLA